jgi:hypothetical protein
MSCVPYVLLGFPSPSSFTSTILILWLVTIDWPRPFNSLCAEYDKDSVKDAYDLETLKEFVQEVGGTDGMEGDDDPSYEESVERVPPSKESDERMPPSLGSVQQMWRDFTAQFRRLPYQIWNFRTNYTSRRSAQRDARYSYLLVLLLPFL